VKRIRHWLFDLDDTLYPAATGLFGHVSRRITRRIADTLGVPEDEARVRQRALWRRYGTSLRGLQVEYGIDPEPFLADVHDVPVEEILAPDPELAELLARLPGQKHVFTNGPSEFVHRVLARLGVDEHFTQVFDIRHHGFVPKPDPQPFLRAMAALGDPAGTLMLVDDSPQNLARARELGWWTAWLRSPHSMAGGTSGLSVAESAEGHAPPHVVLDRLLDLEDGVRAALLSAPAAPPPGA
jgi:putative hydrolase of the HAD superfamily